MCVHRTSMWDLMFFRLPTQLLICGCEQTSKQRSTHSPPHQIFTEVLVYTSMYMYASICVRLCKKYSSIFIDCCQHAQVISVFMNISNPKCEKATIGSQSHDNNNNSPYRRKVLRTSTWSSIKKMKGRKEAVETNH